VHPLIIVGLAILHSATSSVSDGGSWPPAGGQVLSLGIGEPQGEAPALKAKALLEPYLTRALGEKVQVVLLPKYEQLSTALISAQVDLAWVPPIAFVTAHSTNAEIKSLAKARRNGVSYYRSAFIVRKDSPAKSLADLRGKRVAWVDRGSASGYLYPRALLARVGQNPATFFSSEIFAGSHPAVCTAVRNGTVDVGATLGDQPMRGRDFQADGCVDVPPIADFRVIAASEPIANDVVAARAGLDGKLAEAVTQVLMHMNDTPEGKVILADAFRVDGWATPTERDFETVERTLKAATAPVVATEPPFAMPPKAPRDAGR